MTDAILTIALMVSLLGVYLFCLHYLCWVWLYRYITPQGDWVELSGHKRMPWHDVFSNFYGRG